MNLSGMKQITNGVGSGLKRILTKKEKPVEPDRYFTNESVEDYAKRVQARRKIGY